MERDLQSKGKGYSSISYIKALETGLVPIYTPGTFFQQDNVRIHNAKVVRTWFEQHGIWVIDWPPHSPDMNPIEHVWRLLKLEIDRQHPDLYTLKNNAADIAKLKGWIKEAWDRLDQGVIDRLILSMPRRVRALRRAKGWYTKY
jgi:hypothetical protein